MIWSKRKHLNTNWFCKKFLLMFNKNHLTVIYCLHFHLFKMLFFLVHSFPVHSFRLFSWFRFSGFSSSSFPIFLIAHNEKLNFAFGMLFLDSFALLYFNFEQDIKFIYSHFSFLFAHNFFFVFRRAIDDVVDVAILWLISFHLRAECIYFTSDTNFSRGFTICFLLFVSVFYYVIFVWLTFFFLYYSEALSIS